MVAGRLEKMATSASLSPFPLWYPLQWAQGCLKPTVGSEAQMKRTPGEVLQFWLKKRRREFPTLERLEGPFILIIFFLFLILSFTFSPQGVLSGGSNRSMQEPALWERGTVLSTRGCCGPRGWGKWLWLCLSLVFSHHSIQNVYNILPKYEAYKELGRSQVIWGKTMERCQHQDDIDVGIISQGLVKPL